MTQNSIFYKKISLNFVFREIPPRSLGPLTASSKWKKGTCPGSAHGQDPIKSRGVRIASDDNGTHRVKYESVKIPAAAKVHVTSKASCSAVNTWSLNVRRCNFHATEMIGTCKC